MNTSYLQTKKEAFDKGMLLFDNNLKAGLSKSLLFEILVASEKPVTNNHDKMTQWKDGRLSVISKAKMVIAEKCSTLLKRNFPPDLFKSKNY